jgi:hypothetical protein
MTGLQEATEALSKIPHASAAPMGAPPEVTNPPNPEEAAPEETRPSGETQDRIDPAASEPPPIEPPASWDDEAKARFGKLPREDQEYLARRERDRDLAVRRGQDENAKARKAIEAEYAAAVQQAQRYVQQIQFSAQALHQQLLGDFPEATNPAELAKLAATDPARYLEYKGREEYVRAAYEQMATVQRQAQQQQQAKFREWIETEVKKLGELVPDWKDTARMTREVEDIRAYAVSQGFTEQEAQQPWSAAAVAIARKAMLYDKAQKATATAKVANLPKVVRPGTAAEAGEAERTRAEQSLRDFRKTGSLQDAARALAARRAAQR